MLSLRLRGRDLWTLLYKAIVIKFLATFEYIFIIFLLIFLLDFIVVTINLIQLLAAILIRINYLSIYHIAPLEFATFRANPDLCVVIHLEQYLTATATFWGTHVLLRYVKPHKPVSNTTIGKWMKLVLKALTSLSKFCWERMSSVRISFYVPSLLFGPWRLSEFTLSGPLYRSKVCRRIHWAILWVNHCVIVLFVSWCRPGVVCRVQKVVAIGLLVSVLS